MWIISLPPPASDCEIKITLVEIELIELTEPFDTLNCKLFFKHWSELALGVTVLKVLCF